MKIFWSWQSDTPGKVGRYFVRDVLKDALEDLLEETSIEEPQRNADLSEVHLDQDRQGVTGIPDLARTIFSKIKASSVVIADVTAVGVVTGGGKEALPKKLINSNVAIELGFALAEVGESFILMVANGYFGEHSDLPFDLRSKAGPIFFSLEPDASKDRINQEKKQLKSAMKSAIKDCLRARLREQDERLASERLQKKVTAEDWERIGELMMRDGSGVSADSQYQSDTKTMSWTLKGGQSRLCGAHFAKAGAMLLRSPKVSEALPPEIIAEPDHLQRWLTLLQRRGCVTSGHTGWSDLPDGGRIVYAWGSIYDISSHSRSACLEFANFEY